MQNDGEKLRLTTDEYTDGRGIVGPEIPVSLGHVAARRLTEGAERLDSFGIALAMSGDNALRAQGRVAHYRSALVGNLAHNIRRAIDPPAPNLDKYYTTADDTSDQEVPRFGE